MSVCGGPVHRLTVNYYHCVLTGAACLLGQWALSNSERQKQRKEGRALEDIKEYRVKLHISCFLKGNELICNLVVMVVSPSLVYSIIKCLNGLHRLQCFPTQLKEKTKNKHTHRIHE